MGRKNTVLMSFAGGEVTPHIYGREDLPTYQRGWQRIQNYEVLPQGAARYRNGMQHVHNTASLNTGRLVSFTFNEVDTYALEFTNKKLRFYRNFGAIMNDKTYAITNITKGASCSVTAPSHSISEGQEVYITGVVGMKEVNSTYFIATNIHVDTFQLNNIFGEPIDSSRFQDYVSGGTVETPYEIAIPYAAAHLDDLHISQSADTMYITHQKYAPYKLTRTGNTAWTCNFFNRTQDPFKQQTLSGETSASPAVFTTPAVHGLKVGDEVYFDGFVGGQWQSLNTNRYIVDTVPTTTTFTIQDADGNPMDTSSFGSATTQGIVIATKMCPATSAFLGSSRLIYANWTDNPAGLAGSELPNSSTGATQYDNFTPGVNANNAFFFTVSPVFNQQDTIRWITSNNNVVVLGCANTMRIMTGSGGAPNPITPSSIQVTPINNVGASSAQPYSNGMTVFYVDQTTKRIESFVFDIQVYNYVTVNQNLVANHLSTAPLLHIAQQRREASLLWTLRQDGVMLGLTFDEMESVYGWHRHYIGGSSSIDGTPYGRAKVLSMTVEPKLNDDAVLWVLVERQLANGKTYRSVEYWTAPPKWYDPYDWYSGSGPAAQATDTQQWQNAVYEQQKNALHLDMAMTYDGSTAATAGISFSAAGGYGINGGQINRSGPAGSRVAIAIPGEPVDPAGNSVIAIDNFGNHAIPSTGFDAEVGLVVDGTNNVIFSQGEDAGSQGYANIRTMALMSGSSISGAFAPPAAVQPSTSYFVNWQNLHQGNVTNSMAYSVDKAHLFMVVQDISETGFYVVKVKVADGSTEAVSSFITTDGTSPAGLFVSSDGNSVIVVSDVWTPAPPPYVLAAYTFAVSDLSLTATKTINQPATDGSHAHTPYPCATAQSPDGSQIAVTGIWGGFTGISVGNPVGYPVYVYNIGTQTWTTFTSTVNFTHNYQNAAVTWKDNSTLLIGYDMTIATFDVTGTPGTVYDISSIDGSGTGITAMVYDTDSGCVFGSNEDPVAAYLWCYELATTTVKTRLDLGTVSLPNTGIFAIKMLE